jgi:hypothetical protein
VTFPISGFCSDPNGDAVTVASVTQGAIGSVTYSGGNITYTYTTGMNAKTINTIYSDSFTFTASDGHGLTATTTVSVSIEGYTNY